MFLVVRRPASSYNQNDFPQSAAQERVLPAPFWQRQALGVLLTFPIVNL